MAIRFKNVTGCVSLLLLLFMATTAFNCEREKEPEFIIMTFTLPFSIAPSSAQFVLGDTLWVQADFPEALQEYSSKVDYAVKDFDFKSKIGLLKFIDKNITMGEQPSAVDSFDFITKVGDLPFVGETFSPFNFLYQNETYKFKLGLVPKQRGVYCVNFLPPRELDLRLGIKLEKSPDGRERIPAFEYLLFNINNGATNFDLFQQHCKATSLTFPGNQDFTNINYEQKGTFTFEVK
ncbi:MAG: hypothetical protein JNM78_19870 [Cyclobacteriaceae bacterium]|nr:hypothetical protein [Cyclobacteriaceae bacterium]